MQNYQSQLTEFLWMFKRSLCLGIMMQLVNGATTSTPNKVVKNFGDNLTFTANPVLLDLAS